MATLNNFPTLVAIYRSVDEGFQILENNGHIFNDVTSKYSGFLLMRISKMYPLSNTFQFRNMGDRNIYFWHTGYELLTLTGRTIPFFQFLHRYAPNAHQYLKSETSFIQSETWLRQMKHIRNLALKDYEEYKDMPPLIPYSDFSFMQIIIPSPIMDSDGFPVAHDSTLENSPRSLLGRKRRRISTALPTYTADLDVLIEGAKRIWWEGSRTENNFNRKLKVMNLNVYYPQEFLHYLRLVTEINNRSECEKPIDLEFSPSEFARMKEMSFDDYYRDEILALMEPFVTILES